MYIEYKIYVVTDAYDNKQATVANEPSESVHIVGLKNTHGEDVCFEAEAYHLAQWCSENGLRLNQIDMDAVV